MTWMRILRCFCSEAFVNSAGGCQLCLPKTLVEMGNGNGCCHDEPPTVVPVEVTAWNGKSKNGENESEASVKSSSRRVVESSLGFQLQARSFLQTSLVLRNQLDGSMTHVASFLLKCLASCSVTVRVKPSPVQTIHRWIWVECQRLPLCLHRPSRWTTLASWAGCKTWIIWRLEEMKSRT